MIRLAAASLVSLSASSLTQFNLMGSAETHATASFERFKPPTQNGLVADVLLVTLWHGLVIGVVTCVGVAGLRITHVGVLVFTIEITGFPAALQAPRIPIANRIKKKERSSGSIASFV